MVGLSKKNSRSKLLLAVSVIIVALMAFAAFAAVSVSDDVEADAAPVTITVKSNLTYDGYEITVGKVMPGSSEVYDIEYNTSYTGEPAISYEKNVGGSWENYSFTPSEVGTYRITMSFDAEGDFSSNIVTQEFTINQKTVSFPSAYANDKTYNTSTNVLNYIILGEPSGIVAGDDVDLASGWTATVADANAGNDKVVTLTDFVLTGSDASNYTLTVPELTINIVKRNLSVTDPTGIKDKTYDGTDDMPTQTIGTVTGWQGTDSSSVGVEIASAKYDSPNVGSAVSYTVKYQFTAASSDLKNNYNLPDDDTGTGAITVASLTSATFTLTSYSGTYKASAYTVEVASVTLTGFTITSADYNVSYPTDMTNQGVKIIKLTGKDNFTGTTTYSVDFTINKKQLEVTDPTGTKDKTYDASVNMPTQTIGAVTGWQGSDSSSVGIEIASAKYSSANVGTSVAYTVKYQFTSASSDVKNNYVLPVDDTGTGVISAADFSDATFALSSTSGDYKGEAYTVSVSSVTLSGFTITSSDYDVTYPSDMKNVGVKTITLTGKGNFSGTTTASVDFTVNQKALNISSLKGTYNNTTYYFFSNYSTGIKDETIILKATAGSSDAGTYTYVTSTPTSTQFNLIIFDSVVSNYSIASAGNLVIDPASFTGATFGLDSTSGTYKGSAYTVSPKDVTLTGFTITSSDYDVSYPDDMTNAGVKAIKLTGKGNFSGTTTSSVNFTINAADFTGATFVLSAESGTYNGNAYTVGISSVSLTGFTITSSDYDVSYSADMTNAGVKAIKLTGKGNFTGTTAASVDYTINAATLTVTPDSDQSKTYGQADPSSYTYEYSGNVPGQTPGFTGTLTRESGSNAGVYAILEGDLKLADNGTFLKDNYVLSFTAGVEFTINKATITVTPDSGKTKVYGGTDPGFSYTFAGAISSEVPAFTGSLSRAVGEDVGKYNITIGDLALADGTGGFKKDNYTIVLSSTVVQFEITKKTITITGVTATSRDYDGSTTVTLSGGTLQGVESEDSVSFTLGNGTISDKNVGTNKTVTTSITLTGDDCGNYTLTQPTDVTVDITTKTLTVTPDSGKTKIYGGTDPTLTYSSSGAVTGETPDFSGSLKRATGEDVGTYAISNDDLALIDNDAFIASNYSLSVVTTVNFEITKATITVTPDSGKTKIYGGTDPTLTYVSTGAISSEVPAFTGSLSRAEGETVGKYNITKGSLALTDGTGFKASNYDLALSSTVVQFEITKKSITITGVTATSRDYDGFTTVALTGGTLQDVKSGDTVTFTLGNGTISDKNVGTNKTVTTSITLTGDDCGNYTLTQPTDVTVDITTKTLTVTPDSGKTKAYGAEEPELTYTYSGQISGETPDFSGSLKRATGEDVGTYAISNNNLVLVDKDAFIATNYSLSVVTTVNFEITKATITVTPASNQSKIYGDADPNLTYTYSGQQNSETPAFIGSLSRATGENVGTYDITKGSLALTDGTGFKASNYNLVMCDPAIQFEITKKTITITDVTASSRDYDGSTTVALAGGTLQDVKSGDTVTFTLGNGTISDKNVGTGKSVTTSITLTGDDCGNYTLTQPDYVTVNIAAKTLTVTPTAGQSKSYGISDPTLGYGSSGAVDGETPGFTGSIIREVGEDVGTYAITSNNLALADSSTFTASNYSMSFTTGVTFEITQATITVTPEGGQSKSYGSPDPDLYYNHTGEISGETAAFDGALSRESGNDVGTYEITKGTLALKDNGTFKASNYLLEFTEGVDFEISKKSIGINGVTATSRAYDGTTVVTLAGGTLVDVESGDVSDVSFELGEGTADNKNVGTRSVTTAITLSGTKSGNYKLTQPNYITVSITAKTLTVTPTSGLSKFYGGTDPTLTYSSSGAVTGETPDFSGSLKRASGNDVGTYAISNDDLALIDNDAFIASNYSLSVVTTVNFEITKATITVTPASNQSKIYGEANPSLTYTYSGQQYSETPAFTGALSRAAGETVGKYNITIGSLALNDGTGFKKDNYTLVLSSTAVQFEITKATPSITTDPTASAITYGQKLSNSDLTGGVASVDGTFDWTVPTKVPTIAEGSAGLSVTFTPSDTTNYNTNTTTVSLTVNKATPSITALPTASAITYGQTLASSTFTGGTIVNPNDATMSVAGTFTWTVSTTSPAVSDSGVTPYGVTFTPTDAANYGGTTTNVTLTVNKATPTITTVPTASAITYGQTLADSTLSDGVASVDGNFAWTAPTTAPAVSDSGVTSYGVTFTPTDSANYNNATTSVKLVVNKASVTIQSNPTASAITYGQTLADSSFTGGTAVNSVNTSMVVSGTFTWTVSTTAPAVSDSGVTSYGVTFTPTDTANYDGTTTSLKLTVNKATPSITTDPTASSIIYGDALSTSTLSGGDAENPYSSAAVAGAFAWTDGTDVPTVAEGAAGLSVTFTPGDTNNYVSTTTTVAVTVAKKDTSVTTAPTASAITYGQKLSASNLSGGVGSVDGSFAWTDGTFVPTVAQGTAGLSVTFTPSDSANYNNSTITVTLTVNKATPSITADPTASAITYGQTLASSTFSGGTVVNPKDSTMSVTGSFTWAAPATAPAVSDSETTSYNVTFTPTDSANYNTVSTSVTLTVNKATPSITTTPTASAITYGQKLSASNLSGGEGSVEGTFAWTDGTAVPTVAQGTSGMSVTFTPSDTDNYNTKVFDVSLTVNKATPSITADPTASAITYGQTLASSTFTGGTVVNPKDSTMSVTGSFTWASPATAPAVSDSETTSYDVTFTPTDSANYNSAAKSVTLKVNKATPSITTVPTASSITYEDVLSTSTLSGGVAKNPYSSVSIAGSYSWTDGTDVPTVAEGAAGLSVTFTPGDTDNYNTATTTVTVTVAKKDTSVTTAPTASAITYGQTLASSTFTGGDTSVAGSFAWASPTTAPAVSDSQSTEYTVNFTPTDSANYNGTTTKVKLTVNKADSSLTTAPTAISGLTYNQTTHVLINAGSGAVGGTLKYSLDGVTYDTILPTGYYGGTYTVHYKVFGDANHNDSADSTVEATIAKVHLTMPDARADDKIYNRDTDVKYYIMLGDLEGALPGDVVNLSYSSWTAYVDDYNVGENKHINFTGLILSGADAAGYMLDTESITIDIVARTVTIDNISASAKEYDGNTNATLNYDSVEINNIITGDDLSVTAVGTFNNKNIGSYKQVSLSTFELGGTSAENYVIDVSGSQDKTYATIYAAKITVTPNSDQKKTYGEDDPVLTYTYAGNISGETPAFTGTLARAAGFNVGNYAINIGTLALNDNGTFLKDNYELELSETTVYFTINQKTLNITVDIDKTYDGNAIVAAYSSFTTTDLLSDDSFRAGELTTTGANVKDYTVYTDDWTITEDVDTVNGIANYDVHWTVSMEIKRATITVTPTDDQSKTYGESDPELSYAITGSITGETADVSGALSRAAGENVGNYDITLGSLALVDNGEFKASNYELKMCDPAEQFHINKAQITVTPDSDQSKTYGEADPVLTYSNTSAVTGETALFSGALSRDAGNDVGKYDIVKGTLALTDNGDFKASNYDLVMSTTVVQFEIKKATITVTPDSDQFKTYGDAEPVLTFTSAGAAYSETAAFSGTLSRNAGNDVGKYDIVKGTLALKDDGTFKASNYDLVMSTTVVQFEIKKATITVTPDSDQFKYYSYADPTLTYTYEGVVTGETAAFSGALSRDAGEAIGKYDINIGTLALTDNGVFKASNYDLVMSSTVVQFEIKKATPVADNFNFVPPEDLVYDDNPKSASVTPKTGIAGMGTVTVRYFLNAECSDDKEVAPIDVKNVRTYYVAINVTEGDNYTSVTKLNDSEWKFTIIVLDPQPEHFNFSGPSDTIYSSTVKAATVTVKDGIIGMGAVTVRYFTDEARSLAAEITASEVKNARAYYVAIDVAEGDNYKAATKIYDDAWTFTITKATITVTPDSGKTKVYGDADPVFTYTYTDAKGSEVPGFTGALTRESGEAKGIYSILLDGLTLADNGGFLKDNYQLNMCTPAVTFEITLRDLWIDLDISGLGPREYDGTKTVDTYQYVFIGKAGSDVPEFKTSSVQMKSANAGNKIIQIKNLELTDYWAQRYNLKTTDFEKGSLMDLITKATLTPVIDLSSVSSRVYDGTKNVVNVSVYVTPIVSGEYPKVTGTLEMRSANAGNRFVDATNVTLGSVWTVNYCLSSDKVSAEHYKDLITPATPVVKLDGKAVTYSGTSIPIGDAKVTLVNSETYTGNIVYKYYTNYECTAGETTVAPVNAGTYYVKASTEPVTNYYAAVSNKATLIIEKKALSSDMISVDGPFIYDGTAKTVKYTVKDGSILKESDWFEDTGTVKKATDKGTYTVTIKATFGGNYSGTASQNWYITSQKMQVWDKDELVAELDFYEKGIRDDATVELKRGEVSEEASKLLSGKDLLYSYDISLKADGKEYQPDGKVHVRLLIPDNAMGVQFEIYHIHDGVCQKVNYTTDGDYAVFDLDSFSEFVYVKSNSFIGSTLFYVIIGIAAAIALIIVVVHKLR